MSTMNKRTTGWLVRENTWEINVRVTTVRCVPETSTTTENLRGPKSDKVHVVC